MNIKETALAVASFLNLLDQSGKLSITNVAVIVMLIKLAISPSASLTEAGSLLVVLANYSLKRHTNATASSAAADDSSAVTASIEETTRKLTDLESTVSSLALQAGLKG